MYYKKGLFKKKRKEKKTRMEERKKESVEIICCGLLFSSCQMCFTLESVYKVLTAQLWVSEIDLTNIYMSKTSQRWFEK